MNREDGLFINAIVNQNCVSLLLDMGSNISILNQKLFYLWPNSRHLEVEPVTQPMVTVTGEIALLHGKVCTAISLGSQNFSHTMYLANKE